MSKPSTATMLFGVIIFVATLGAWLWGETHGVDTNIVWVVATPVITALFVGQQIGAAADAAKQAAAQTNGGLHDRIKSAVAGALADRDAARTRQAQGDVSEDRAATAATARLSDSSGTRT